jgi:MFS family permease
MVHPTGYPGTGTENGVSAAASDVAGLQWTLNGYLVALASLILLGGSLGDRLGRRRIFRVGVAWFTGASLLCALAPSVEILIAARAAGCRWRAGDAGQPGDHRGDVPGPRSRSAVCWPLWPSARRCSPIVSTRALVEPIHRLARRQGLTRTR